MASNSFGGDIPSIIAQQAAIQQLNNQKLSNQLAQQLQAANLQRIQDEANDPIARQIQAAKLQQLQYELANPNAQFQNQAALLAQQQANALALENFRQSKPTISEQLGVEFIDTPQGRVARRIPIQGSAQPQVSLQDIISPSIQIDSSPLSLTQPAAQPASNDLSTLIQNFSQNIPSAPQNLTGTLAQQEAAKRSLAELEANQKAADTKSQREFTTSERGAHEEFLKGLAEIKAENKSLGTMQGYDTRSGTFGIFTPDENGKFAEGIVPSANAPKSAANKPIPITQADQFTGLNLLESRLNDIEKTPKDVRAANVGWIDSALGSIQGITGLGKSSDVARNDAFRTAVDSLVGEFSFGRGGKALTVNEREILGKYVPSLTNSDSKFESRIQSFRNLVHELRDSRLQSLEDSGYNVDKLRASSGGETTESVGQLLKSGQISKEEALTRFRSLKGK